MEILHALITSVVSIIVMFFLVKLMGNKEITQLSTFDHISSITIGSIAAELAISPIKGIWVPLSAMVIYALIVTLMAVLGNKSIVLRRFFEGRTLVLMDKGKIIDKNLSKARIDINEFLRQCRVAGFFDISDIESAVMEGNGKLSVLPRSDARPATPKDLNIPVKSDGLVTNIIIDGKVLHQNLAHSGKNMTWVNQNLHSNGIGQISEVMLAYIDSDGKLSAYRKQGRKDTHDTFDM